VDSNATNAIAPPRSSGITSRLLRGVGASALGPLVTTLIQVVSVPIFLHFWGAHLYGEWLILSAIPTYLALSDFGFGSVASNDMTMQVGKGDHNSAQHTFQSAWLLTTSISLTVALLAALVIGLLPLTRWLHLTAMTGPRISLTLLLLVACVLFGFQANMISAGFRCDGNFAYGTMWGNFVRFAEAAAVVVIVTAHGGPVSAAASMLAIRIVGNLWLQTALRRRSPWLHYGVAHASLDVVRRLWAPAMAYMAFPAGNALNFQGILLAVGAVLGPIPVVVFSTLRTLARLPTQLTMIVQSGVWPELSRAHGASNNEIVRSLHRYSCQASIWISGGAAAVLALGGTRILSLWTHGKVPMNTPVFLVLLLEVVVNSLWISSLVALLATNRHERAALVYLAATAISLPVSYLLMRAFGLVGAAEAMLLVDVLCVWTVLRNSLALVEDTLFRFCTSLFTSPPALRALLERRGTAWR